MTCRELYLQARRVLGGAGVDSPSFDAAALTDNACADGAVTEGEHAR